ncbi:MAG TPA: hypothetical protein VM388_07410 [Acidimicrobiales bacterium]|nr:hypothetical protein [Acidimicrobiales bacterium]
MPRIDIELTSSRPDGTWTWRAAGARQPKGVLEGSVLYDGAKVGDVLKAEADFDLDGINVTSVVPPKAKKAAPETLQLLGSGKEEALVTHSPLKPEREGGERGRRGERGDRFGGGGFGGGGRGGPGGRGERGPVGPDGRPLGPGATRPRATPTPAAGPREGARREGRGTGGPGTSRERARPDRPERPRSERPGGPPREGGVREGARRDRPPREGAGRERSSRPPAAAPPARPRPPAKRLSPGRAHRDAMLGGLAPEQRAIAEQVMRGGLAGVRAAVDEQNKQARAAGGPEIKADAILSLAEELFRSIQAAEWRDKAEAAAGMLDEISLRDLRTVVAGADAGGRDEESRALAARLREGLERRSAAERQAWTDEIATCLGEGRVVRALRVSSRAPEQGLRLPPELSTGLSTAAGEAMSADTAPDRWLAVLEAALTSPVRRSLVPKGLPNGADEASLKTIRAAIPKVPALGPLLGETPPTRPVPPPPPRRPPAPPAPAAAAQAASTPAEAAAIAAPVPADSEPPPSSDPGEAVPEPGADAPPAQVPAEPAPVGDGGEASPPPAPEPPLLIPAEPPPAPGAAPPLLLPAEPPPGMGTPAPEPEGDDAPGDQDAPPA